MPLCSIIKNKEAFSFYNHILRITELTLYTAEIPSIKNFYGKILSFKILSESADEIIFEAGETKLIFKKYSGAKSPFYHFAFNIPSNKIEEAIQWMKGKAELLLISDNNYIADFENWNAKSIYFLDTVGNIVEFIARFDLDNDSSVKFDSSQILNVSEIGIVIGDVLSYKQILIDKYKVFDFVKSVNSGTFSAMGDDNGLFIVASEKRNWYPTQMASQKFPFEIKFINDSGETNTLTDKIM